MISILDSFFKRSFDFIMATVGLLILFPVIILALIAVWLNDYKNPFYIPQRIGINGKPFKMLKIRTMIADADKAGIDSTSADDERITAPGHLIRKFKLDELIQLYNVIKGDMSLVGPRPNVGSETALYTNVEKRLLNVKPGITDLSSIVFSDLAEILQGSEDANLTYNQYVRPWKSRLSLFYIENRGFLLDICIIILTLVSVFSRITALNGTGLILRGLKAPDELIGVSRRDKPLKPYPPPGSDSIVTVR